MFLAGVKWRLKEGYRIYHRTLNLLNVVQISSPRWSLSMTWWDSSPWVILHRCYDGDVMTDRSGVECGIMICRVDTWPSIIMPSNNVHHMRDRSQVADTREPGSQDHNSPTPVRLQLSNLWSGHSQLSAIALISPLYSHSLSYPSCVHY